MNKKVLVSAFALSMVFGLTGCSSEKPEEKRKIQRLLKRKKSDDDKVPDKEDPLEMKTIM